METVLSPKVILIVVLCYFGVLFFIAELTAKKSNSTDFYLGGKKSPWYIVAFGMIGASLSGVTFISVPGWVDGQQFGYMQMVLGYLLGYYLIATVLLPLYYRLNLTSIYTYLRDRLGIASYKTGASYFLLSRVIGAAFRLYLVAIVLQQFVSGPYGVPFWATVLITIVLIWIYTFRGGIKTIIWTDTLQTASMLLAVGLSVRAIAQSLDWSWTEMWTSVMDSPYSRMIFLDGAWTSDKHFVKQFLAGASIAFVMTGLDQDMMQKNLSMRTLRDAQKNMFWFSIILVGVNFLFLFLGASLYLYASAKGVAIPTDLVQGKEIIRTDLLYPTIALGHLTPLIGMTFVVGLIAAAYSSADSALTALTTSFCVDILDLERKNLAEQKKRNIRWSVHVFISLLLFGVILFFKQINDGAVIAKIFQMAGYTYGPILGLYLFGLFSKRNVFDRWVPLICFLAPVLTYGINVNSKSWFFGYQFGFELLLLNGFLTWIGLMIFSTKDVGSPSAEPQLS